MARPKSDFPAMRYHVCGQAIVTIDGKDYYLGKHNTPQAHARYAYLIAEYQRNGLSLPDSFDVRGWDSFALALTQGAPPVTHQADEPILVKHLMAAYNSYAQATYAHCKSERLRARQITNEITKAHGELQVDQFGPKMLKALRETWTAARSRQYINKLSAFIVQIFKWGVSEELVQESTWTRLKAVEALRFGRTDAKEGQARKPVSIAVVRATVVELSPVVRDMVRVHVATGMRPTELCSMRPCDIDRSGDVWMYRPEHHKNKAKGKPRAIPIIGNAREVVTNYLNRDPKAYLFSPSEAVALWQAKKRLERKSKVQPSQLDRSKDNPETRPGECYTQDSYRRAIDRACKRANVERWFPYQLRHLTLTEIRDALGVEAAQAMGGHSRIDMTEVYAKLSESKAIEAAKAAPKL